MTALLICLISAVLAMLRIFGITAQWFQAVAHLWVGGLAGAWLVGADHWLTAILFWGLCVVEVVCFACDRLGIKLLPRDVL